MKTLAEFHFDASLAERYKADILYAARELAKLAHSGKVLGIGENVALEMTSLATRLEAASEGSRELSDEMLLVLGFTEWRLRHKPDPTRSIDDGLTMVPEGWGWDLGCNLDPGQMYSSIIRGPFDTARPEGQSAVGFSNSPALALCIALLAAKEQADD